MVGVRAARPGEAAALTALCRRSKAHWGYDVEFMRRAAPALTVVPAMIETGQVLVAEGPLPNPPPHAGEGGVGLLGVVAVDATPRENEFDLALLFVEPSAIGSGVGRRLFEAAAKLVEMRGGTSLSILADPFAEAFYEHLGAVRIGEAPSDAIPGRMLPLLQYEIC